MALHSYRVAVLAMAIRDALSGVTGRSTPEVDEAALLRWALLHDGPEAKTGDIPRPVKELLGHQAMDALEHDACDWFKHANPGGLEEFIVSIADTIEALSWIKRYGHGLRCRFDGHAMEARFEEKIRQMAEALEEGGTAGGKSAVLKVMTRAAF